METDKNRKCNCWVTTAVWSKRVLVAAICHWGSRPEATSFPPSFILLSSLPCRGLSRGSGQSSFTRCQTLWCSYLYNQTAL